jgi:hypothetical protein
MRKKLSKRVTQHVQNLVDWDVFFDRLYGPEGCNFRPEDGENIWNCKREAGHPFSRTILARMGVLKADIDKCIKFFEAHGGYCDCEVVFNVEDDLVATVASNDA